jgi:hypothetical protein
VIKLDNTFHIVTCRTKNTFKEEDLFDTGINNTFLCKSYYVPALDSGAMVLSNAEYQQSNRIAATR